MTAMIAIKNLSKRFGPILAVDDISFSVERGEVLGFLGPNGAGKSTTMRILTGFLAPSDGSVEVCGFDVVGNPLEAKRRIGYLPEGAPGYPDMTPASFLRFVAEVRGYSGAEKQQRIDAAVARTHLEGVLHQPVDTLSKGFRRRVGLAQALLHDPEVLILDEPTDGLDPIQKHEVRQLIADMAPDKAIVISTHILEEVEAVCSRAIIIDKGRLVADGTPEDFVARARHHNAVYLTLATADVPKLRAALADNALVATIEETPYDGDLAALVVLPKDRHSSILTAVGQVVRDGRWPVGEMRVETGKLDDVFRQITAESSKDSAEAARD